MPFDSEIDYDEPIPVFPLGQLVLLPHAAVPLHIFEPRYREMTRDALRGDKLIAMAVFDPEENWAQQYGEAPALRPCVCVGRIVEYQELPDGRYHLLLQGRARARIVEELHVQEYRSAMLEPIESDPAMEIDLSEHRKRIVQLLRDPRMQELAMMGQVNQWLGSELSTDAMVDAVTLLLCRDPRERYAMLAEADAHARADRLTAILTETRDTLALAEPMFGKVKTEDGFFLN